MADLEITALEWGTHGRRSRRDEAGNDSSCDQSDSAEPSVPIKALSQAEADGLFLAGPEGLSRDCQFAQHWKSVAPRAAAAALQRLRRPEVANMLIESSKQSVGATELERAFKGCIVLPPGMLSISPSGVLDIVAKVKSAVSRVRSS